MGKKVYKYCMNVDDGRIMQLFVSSSLSSIVHHL